MVTSATPTPCPTSNDVFVRGTYVEFGLHHIANSFGSDGPAPADFHVKTGGYTHLPQHKESLGFVADYGRDGWTVGSPPFSGDYFVPGQPFEGWAVEFDGNAYENAGMEGRVDILPESDTLVSSDGVVTWVGQQGDLRITQQSSIYDGDSSTLGLEVTVTLTNVGSADLTNVCYSRNVDPDQEQPWTTNYDTHNSIYYQPTVPEGIDGEPNPGSAFASVVATGVQHRNLVQVMLTADPRVRVHSGRSNTRTPCTQSADRAVPPGSASRRPSCSSSPLLRVPLLPRASAACAGAGRLRYPRRERPKGLRL